MTFIQQETDTYFTLTSPKGKEIGVSFGVTYGVREFNAAGRDDDEQLGIELGGKYKLGPGVEARGSIFYADRDEGISGPVGPGGSNGDSYYAVSAVDNSGFESVQSLAVKPASIASAASAAPEVAPCFIKTATNPMPVKIWWGVVIFIVVLTFVVVRSQGSEDRK
jgi:hypothetical protein